MKCAFCQKDIPEEVPEKSCGQCVGGCRKVHCPYCGYANPLPSGWLERMFGRNDDNQTDGNNE